MPEKFTIAKENTIRGRLFYGALKLLVGPAIRLAWIKKVEGLENLPAGGPYILAANHQSYLDFLSISSIWPERLTFLAAEKFYSSRFWRPIMEYTGQIKVERNAEDKGEAIATALEVLKQGRVLAIFPQGTRSRSGEIEKTYTGVARLALTARVKVVPVGIKGAFEVMTPNEKFPRLKKVIEIKIGAPMDFSDCYGQEGDRETGRKITNEIMVEIARLAEKKYSPELA